MPQENATSLNTLWILAVAAAAFAIGVATSDAVRDTVFDIRDVIMAYKGGNIPHALTELPSQAQLIYPSAFAAMPVVPPENVANVTSIFIPPGFTMESLRERPFHIYHPDFMDILGPSPTLTLIADSGTNPLFHEAVVWYPPTDEVFFAQSAGPLAAGTGLKKSSLILKISLAEAMAVSNERDAIGKVQVHTVPTEPTVINPNGGTNYKGTILFTGEGMGPNIAPALFAVNPIPPYNTTGEYYISTQIFIGHCNFNRMSSFQVLVNNYFGRQFNSLNDVAVNFRNKHIYFTDTVYGYLQDFRPRPGLPNHVYRLDPLTKAVTVVADEFVNCNGITFSHDGRYAYITDTGAGKAFRGYDNAGASTM
ncbi:gluconolactonase [Trichoderma arundinaceum]|uniref:Gluconolactonase n=1 Tax=Trichoderma arundinaceum TaxID=490622 RepID=A0A395ND80_TRIAR|nr:gluconolactonase [Trichoderma arundinaceum]